MKVFKDSTLIGKGTTVCTQRLSVTGSGYILWVDENNDTISLAIDGGTSQSFAVPNRPFWIFTRFETGFVFGATYASAKILYVLD